MTTRHDRPASEQDTRVGTRNCRSGAKASADASHPWQQVKEDRVNEPITQAVEPEGDFASGDRAEPKTAEEELEATFKGDFAAGKRTEAQATDEAVPGTFADTDT